MTKYLNATTRNGGVDQIVVADRPSAAEVEEAPFDDAQYVRLNGEWVPATTPEIVPDTLAPSSPTGLSAVGSLAGADLGVDYTLSWVPPTTNADGSTLTDLAYYVVRWRYAGTEAYASFVSNDAAALLPGLAPGTNIEWDVLARDISGNDSPWASDVVDGVDTLKSVEVAGNASYDNLEVTGETGLVPVLGYQLAGNVATIFTTRQHGFEVDDTIFIAGTVAPFDGLHLVLDVSSTSFTFVQTNAPVPYTVAGEDATVNLGTALQEDPEPSGFTIYGTEFLEWIEQQPKGVVAWENFGTDKESGAVTERGYGEIGFQAQPGRMYRVQVRGMIENDTDNSIWCRLRMTQAAAPAAAATPTVTSQALLQFSVLPLAWNGTANDDFHFSDWTYLVGPPKGAQAMNIRILLTMGGGGATNTVMRAYGGGSSSLTMPEGGVMLSVEDIGLSRGQGGAYNTGGVTPPGTPPPVPVQTYTKTWSSNNARCYMGNGAADSSQGAEDMKQGYSSFDGDSRSIWTFPTFTGAVGAESIDRVRLYLYANHWYYNSGGTAKITRHNYSSVPSSNPSVSSVASSTKWPKPGGRWITLPTSVHAGIIAGTIKGFGVGPAGTNNLLYYGRFNKSGAKVEITYKR